MPIPALPPKAQELAGLVGTDAALRICEAVGGLRPYVPLAMPDGHPLFDKLSRAAGEAAARMVFEQYAGDFLDLPKCEAWFKHKLRNAAILAGGKPVDALAAEAGLTRRRVFQIKAQARASADRNADMFA